MASVPVHRQVSYSHLVQPTNAVVRILPRASCFVTVEKLEQYQSVCSLGSAGLQARVRSTQFLALAAEVELIRAGMTALP